LSVWSPESWKVSSSSKTIAMDSGRSGRAKEQSTQYIIIIIITTGVQDLPQQKKPSNLYHMLSSPVSR
jgi:hypothetical protein